MVTKNKSVVFLCLCCCCSHKLCHCRPVLHACFYSKYPSKTQAKKESNPRWHSWIIFLFEFHADCKAPFSLPHCVECLSSGSCAKCKENFALKLWSKGHIGHNVCDGNCEKCVEPRSGAQVCKTSAGDNKKNCLLFFCCAILILLDVVALFYILTLEKQW